MDNADNRRVMIRLSEITKAYRIGQIGYGSLNRDLQSWWARKRHRPDPNLKIGMEQRLTGDTIMALNGVDLTVYQGERVGIIGGNGAGKSTLLKLITRVTVPTEGTMDLYGRVTSMLEVGTGFHGEMTGRENIYLNGTILGMNRREIDEKLEQIIDFSEVRNFIDTPVKRYSSGMYVKLAFSVAAHLNSEIIIMDEVLAVGDEAFQKKCIRKMRETSSRENRTVLYVSHNMETIRALCDRVVVMADGRIVFDGDAEEAIGFYRAFLTSSEATGGRIGDELRRDRNLSGLCRMTDLCVMNAEASGNEDIRFRLCLSAAGPLKNVGIRIMVNNGAGQMVGMANTRSFPLAGGDTWMDLRLPAGCLAPDGYACDLALFSYDGNTQTRHDYLPKALRFRVEDARLYFGNVWKPGKWGSVKLPEIKIGADEDENER